jgi:hypothetical protein
MCQRFASSEDWLRSGTFPPLRLCRRDLGSSLATLDSSLATIRCLPTDIALFTRTTHCPPPSPPTARRKSGSFCRSISDRNDLKSLSGNWLTPKKIGFDLALSRHSDPSAEVSPLHWPLATGHSPLVTRHSPLSTRHSQRSAVFPPTSLSSPELPTADFRLPTAHHPLPTAHCRSKIGFVLRLDFGMNRP